MNKYKKRFSPQKDSPENIPSVPVVDEIKEIKEDIIPMDNEKLVQLTEKIDTLISEFDKLSGVLVEVINSSVKKEEITENKETPTDPAIEQTTAETPQILSEDTITKTKITRKIMLHRDKSGKIVSADLIEDVG